MKLRRLVGEFTMAGYVLLISITALAQEEPMSEVTIDASPDSAAIAAADAAAASVVQQPMVDYQNCIKKVIANEVPVADKAEAIASDCGSQRRALQMVLPAEFGDFLLLNMDRRINMILTAMQDAETVVADTVTDAEEIRNAIPNK